MTEKICIIGSPGCGKSTLTADIFVAFKKLGYNTELVPEWIRKDISRNGVMESVWEQFRTLDWHRREEESFPPEVQYLLVDSGVLTPYFYSALYAKKNNPRERLVIQDMHAALLDDLYNRRYDHIFFVPRFRTDQAGLSFQDGVRFQKGDETEILESYMTLMFTKVHRLDNIHILDCELRYRVGEIVRTILGEEEFKRWLQNIRHE